MVHHVTNWADRFYHDFILWPLGFRNGEHISDMLARQKQRFGAFWHFFPISTILITLGGLAYLSYLIYDAVKFHKPFAWKAFGVAMLCILLGFFIWCYYHIITYSHVDEGDTILYN